MKKTLPQICDALKKIALKIFKVLENIWIKRVSTVLIIIYAIYLLYSNFRALKDSIAALSFNIPLVVLSAVIVLLTFILNISSWKYIVASFGYTHKWIDMAYVQMASAIGKYIPGKIWNYSSKIYLSHQLGLPGSIASLALGVEVLLTYIIGACLFLILVPSHILDVSSSLIIVMRIAGGLLSILVCISPLLLSKITWTSKYFKKPNKLYFSILYRIGVWVFSSLSFSFLLRALGFSPINFLTLISVIAGSFFFGFIVIFIPDGIFVRETIMVFLLQEFISKPDASILSILFRGGLVILELMIILVVFLVYKKKSRVLR
jgi:glycosyltransferase 2 family protein